MWGVDNIRIAGGLRDDSKKEDGLGEHGQEGKSD